MRTGGLAAGYSGAMSTASRRTDSAPVPAVDPVANDGVGAVLAGIVIWTVVGLLALASHARLAEQGRTWMIWACCAGALWGLGQFGFVWRRHKVYRQHRDTAVAAPDAGERSL